MDMVVSINEGCPKWLVYDGKSHLEMDDLGDIPISGNHHMERKLARCY